MKANAPISPATPISFEVPSQGGTNHALRAPRDVDEGSSPQDIWLGGARASTVRSPVSAAHERQVLAVMAPGFDHDQLAAHLSLCTGRPVDWSSTQGHAVYKTAGPTALVEAALSGLPAHLRWWPEAGTDSADGARGRVAIGDALEIAACSQTAIDALISPAVDQALPRTEEPERQVLALTNLEFDHEQLAAHLSARTERQVHWSGAQGFIVYSTSGPIEPVEAAIRSLPAHLQWWRERPAHAGQSIGRSEAIDQALEIARASQAAIDQLMSI